MDTIIDNNKVYRVKTKIDFVNTWVDSPDNVEILDAFYPLKKAADDLENYIKPREQMRHMIDYPYMYSSEHILRLVEKARLRQINLFML